MNKERGREREGGNKTSDKDSPVVISSDSYHNNYYNILMYTCSKDQRSICYDISHSTCPTKTTVCYHKTTVCYW